jgi:hypothetical protein
MVLLHIQHRTTAVEEMARELTDGIVRTVAAVLQYPSSSRSRGQNVKQIISVACRLVSFQGYLES